MRRIDEERIPNLPVDRARPRSFGSTSPVFFLIGHERELGEPRRRLAVARGAPIAARRERATGADLRPVRDAAALELARAKEFLGERPEMALDFADVIGAAQRLRNTRPPAGVALVPGAPGEESDLAWRIAEARRV